MDTGNFIIEDGALELAPVEYRKTWGNACPLIIADRNTWLVAGMALKNIFLAAGYIDTEAFIFPDEQAVYADYAHVEIVRRAMENKEFIAVAVGSGTINDLVKLASYELGRTYMIVPTAPSVDGFTSTGAAITVNGFKITLPCPAPAVVVADSLLLRQAPYPMIASGYGDLSAKITAGADWLIADHLGIEPVVATVWNMVQGSLKAQLSDPQGLAHRDRAVIEGLFLGLVQVGYAMQIYRDSRPASGADHLISHVWEMDHLTFGGKAVSHGFKVAIGTLTSTAIMTELLKRSKDDLKHAFESNAPILWEVREGQIRALIGTEKGLQVALDISHSKFPTREVLESRRQEILDSWDVLKKRIENQIIPFKQLKEMYRIAQCPTEPTDIGLDKAEHIRGIRIAQLIRKRYTVLDLAYEMGLFDEIIDVVVGSGVYFERPTRLIQT